MITLEGGKGQQMSYSAPAIEHQLKGLERVGAPVPRFDPYDLAKGNETLDAPRNGFPRASRS